MALKPGLRVLLAKMTALNHIDYQAWQPKFSLSQEKSSKGSREWADPAV